MPTIAERKSICLTPSLGTTGELPWSTQRLPKASCYSFRADEINVGCYSRCKDTNRLNVVVQGPESQRLAADKQCLTATDRENPLDLRLG